MNSGQNKFFLKKCKKSVAKIVRFFDAYSKKIALMRGDRKFYKTDTQTKKLTLFFIFCININDR